MSRWRTRWGRGSGFLGGSADIDGFLLEAVGWGSGRLGASVDMGDLLEGEMEGGGRVDGRVDQ